MISVVIPVKDGGAELVRCLEAVRSQQISDEVEIVVIDSGSSDGSPERARLLGARIHEISSDQFNHGRARNLGAERSRGDILVFTTQDACAHRCDWLATLVAPLQRDPSVAGVYGRQIPHDTATPPERYFLNFLYGPHARVQRVDDPAGLTFESTLFSNVNAAMTRATWQDFPFTDDIVMSEDQEWSRRVLLAGHSIVYEPEAAVFHSHKYTIAAAFRRFFDSGVSAARSYVGDSRNSRAVLWTTAVRYARGELAWLWRTRQRRWIPYAAVYEAAKFAGLQLGRRHRWLPSRAKRRLSGIPAYWEATVQASAHSDAEECMR